MLLKSRKPSTHGLRNQIVLSKHLLVKQPFLKNTFFDTTSTKHSLRNRSGRALSHGKITMWNRGGRVSRQYSFLEELKKDVSVVIACEHNSFTTNFKITKFSLGFKKYFNSSSTDKLYPGCIVSSLISDAEFYVGSRFLLKQIPPGSLIHSVSHCGNNSSIKYAKAAGSSALLLRTLDKTSDVKLPSGKVLQLPSSCSATLGASANPSHFKIRLSKAGQNRHRGWRSHVRGIAMNPVDHPHGGRTNGGKPSVTPWGLPTKCSFKLKKKR